MSLMDEYELRRRARRDGERDFERGGRYGYDERRYLGHGSVNRTYQESFDAARREHDRREEERAEADEVRRQQEAQEARWRDQVLGEDQHDDENCEADEASPADQGGGAGSPV